MARHIRSTAVHVGRNRENVSRKDDRYVRCARCGFICHLDRDVRHPDGSRAGWGINYDDPDVTEELELVGTGSLELISGGALELASSLEGITDPVVKGGCPQCGTYRYDK